MTPTVTIESPAGQERWTGGTVHSITWTMEDVEDSILLVDIEYLVNGVPTTIVNNDPRFTGSNAHAWTVPIQDLANVTVRVCAEDGVGAIGCDVAGSFQIDATRPSLVSRSPDGTNVGLDEPIVLDFSEGMNLTRIQSALTVSPNPGGVQVSKWTATAIRVDHNVFAAGAEYDVGVACTASDLSDSGNALAGCPASWSFTTSALPSIGLTRPAVGTVWTAGSTQVVEWNASDADDPVAVLQVYLDLSLDGTTFNPLAGPLAGDATYAWALPITDVATARLRARAVDTRGLNATVTSPAFAIDATAPAITAGEPAQGAKGVDWLAPVVAMFSEAMNVTAGLDALSVRSAAGAWVPGNVSWDSPRTARFRPSLPYRADTTYVAQVNATARDASLPGNPLASPVSWMFTTRANAGPSVTLATALSGHVSAGSSWNLSWTATDAEDLPGDLRVYVEFSDGGPFVVVGGPRPANGTFMWTAPPTNIAAAAFRVRVVDSQSWDAMAEVTFGVDATPPRIVAASPGAGQVDVLPDSPIEITFSEPMNPASSVGLREAASGAWVAVVAMWDNPARLRLTPAAPLRETIDYEVVANASVRDASRPGNPLAASSWAFQVASVPPTLAVLAPAPGTRWTAGVPQTTHVEAADRQDLEVTLTAHLALDGSTFVPLLDPMRRPNGPASFYIVPPAVDAPNAVLRVCAADGSGAASCVTVEVILDALAPHLVAAAPASGAMQVHPEAPIVLTFSEPMVPATVEAAFAMRPVVPTTFRWARTVGDNDTLFIDHSRLLELGAYTVTLGCGARDESMPGLSLGGACPVAWTFMTAAAPDVRLLLPVGGERLSGGATHTFRWIATDEESNLRARVELSLDGGATFPIRLVDFEPFLVGDARVARAIPTVDADAAVVRVIVMDSLGLATAAVSAPFAIDATPPRLLSATPADAAADVSPLEDIVLVFSESMNPTSLAPALAVSPPLRDPVVTWTTANEPFDTVTLSHAAFRLGRTVTVSLAGIRDASQPGNALTDRIAFSIVPDREKPNATLRVARDAIEGEVVVLDATDSSDNDEIVAFEWTIQDESGRPVARFPGARVEYRAVRAGMYSVTVEVVDASGNAARASAVLRIWPVGSIADGVVLPVSFLDWLAFLGSAGATAYGLTDRGRSFLSKIIFLPLYVKLRGSAVLNHETRGMIRGYILVNPGDCYTDIKRNLGLANGECAYHLGVLEREGVVRSVTRGARRVYYPADAPIPVAGGLHAVQARLLRHVEAVPGMSVRDLAGLLGVSSQLALYHVRKLGEAGLVRFERHGVKLRVHPTGEEERIRRRRREDT